MQSKPHRFGTQATVALGLIVSFAACTPEPTAPPVLPTSSASAIFAADFDGDGNDEIATVADGALHWMDNEFTLRGSVAAHASVDLDTDGSEELVLALRRSRTHPEADPQLLVVNAVSTQAHAAPKDGRYRITDLSVHGNRLFVTILGSSKDAVGGWWTPTSFEAITASTMGMSQQVVTDETIAVGRIYGDAPKSNGRLELHSGSTVRVLPGRRGVRTLATADINRDGHSDIVAADGWHFKYGEHAEARLSVYLGPDFSDYRMIGTIDGDYTINRIDAVPTVPPTIVATGTSKVVAFTLDEMGWTPIIIGTTKEGARATVVTTHTKHWLALPGEAAEIRQLPSF